MKSNYNNREKQIIRKIWNTLNTKKCNQKIHAIKKLQFDFFVESILKVLSHKDEQSIYNNYLECSLKCFDLTNLEIINNENEKRLNIQNGLIVISNHLGSNKITKITKNELNSELQKHVLNKHLIDSCEGFINDDPFLIIAASVLKTINSIIDFSTIKISIALIDFPFPISEVAINSNHFLISRTTHNQYDIFETKLIEKAILAKQENKFPVFIIFPEGGTSGKHNDGSPYSLGEFHKGYLRFAFKNNIPILPIIQIFNSEFNFYTKILEFIHVSNDNEETNESIREKMQIEINSLINEDNFNIRP